ncbi:pyridoxal phosphate homeostasis protein [Teleopsis dalmanni]|uniref:pyridoxal phosphate homeostasis protein n=1 Tax=Teleopsis dalmanni TaxID=139649 RepID=UPI0018CDC053|nr:pyridoxal phosphate homeostasis protein [Teleopsis dalmanni]XP_037956818.1 pyridoxal phosphate homeostasis protein [Teleopsis dalmanni]
MLRSKMCEIGVEIQNVLKRIDVAYGARSKDIKTSKPYLVAVSKTKPVNMIIEAYEAGQRHFGENYVKELVVKAQDPEILQKCPDIKWHFIGHLQNNKINKVVKLPNLHMIQTIDDEKIATGVNAAWEKLDIPNKQPLRVLIQINTSGEEAKNGIQPNEASSLFKYIKENLKNLQLEGIMTIGAFGHDYTTGPNPDFISLMKVHNQICIENEFRPEEVQISMGISNDFDKAIEMGSTIVRVGSSIFGSRVN